MHDIINRVVVLTNYHGKFLKGKLGLITSGSYYGNFGRVSNYWMGNVLDEDGKLTPREFGGYNNGDFWEPYNGEYKVEGIRVVFGNNSKSISKERLFQKKEYLLCAAIWFDDGNKHHNQPNNIKSGLVFCGWRHGCIFPQIGGTVGERQKLGIYEKEQGFLTSKNRFVDRVEAAKIAFEAGQIKEAKDYLFSEDLY